MASGRRVPRPGPVEGSARAVLYTRAQCPLCEEMRAQLERARDRIPFVLRVVDVDGDAALQERYGLSVPVLEIEGGSPCAVFEGRVGQAELERELAKAGREELG